MRPDPAKVFGFQEYGGWVGHEKIDFPNQGESTVNRQSVDLLR